MLVVDGKVLKGSCKKDKKAVSVVLVESQFIIAHKEIANNSNEIQKNESLFVTKVKKNGKHIITSQTIEVMPNTS